MGHMTYYGTCTSLRRLREQIPGVYGALTAPVKQLIALAWPRPWVLRS
jgi:hypothetical protein